MQQSVKLQKYSNDKILCLVGASGSGKTTITEALEDKGWNVLSSYTTRPKRTPDEKHHIFVDQAGFDAIRHELAAHTIFDGNEYGATMEQVHNSHIYVIDPSGVEKLFDYLGRDRVFVVYLSVSPKARYKRMLEKRGAESAAKRIEHDAPIYDNYMGWQLSLPNNYDYELDRNVATIVRYLNFWYGNGR